MGYDAAANVFPMPAAAPVSDTEVSCLFSARLSGYAARLRDRPVPDPAGAARAALARVESGEADGGDARPSGDDLTDQITRLTRENALASLALVAWGGDPAGSWVASYRALESLPASDVRRRIVELLGDPIALDARLLAARRAAF